jgi:hypothetical protein
MQDCSDGNDPFLINALQSTYKLLLTCSLFSGGRLIRNGRLRETEGIMSILFVLLTFLVVVSVNYLWFRPAQALPVAAYPSLPLPAPVMKQQAGFSIPQHAFTLAIPGCFGKDMTTRASESTLSLLN